MRFCARRVWRGIKSGAAGLQWVIYKWIGVPSAAADDLPCDSSATICNSAMRLPRDRKISLRQVARLALHGRTLK
eukprot:3808987-Amphidinium_carterae.1